MKNIFSVFLFLVTTSVLYSINITENGIIFEYDSQNAQSVYLAGSMNDWDTSATPMQKEEDGVWRVLLDLDFGSYSYKFFVDGNWQLDQDNPDIEDDGYGGSNSIIIYSDEYNSNKKYLSSIGGVKSIFNPKIFFKGQYFSNNIFIKNNADRFSLDKPGHDLNFGIIVKFNSDFEAYTLLNVNNTKEEIEMWKTHFNYKRSMLKLNADFIDVVAFENMGLFSFDSPLNLIGDIGYNKYKFGYDYSGLYAETSTLFSNKFSSIVPIDVFGQVLISDKVGYSEDDVSAMRVKLSKSIYSTSKISLGTSRYQYTTTESDQFYQRHDSQAYDFKFEKDIRKTGWKKPMRFSISAEYSEYENSDNGTEKNIWMDGDNIYLGVSLKFPEALKIYGNYMHRSFRLNGKSSVDEINIGAFYKHNKFIWNLSLGYWKNNISDNLGWVDYYKYFEKSSGNGRWFQEHSDVMFHKYSLLGYDTGLMWESKMSYTFELMNRSLKTVLANRIAQHDLLITPKYIESILVFEYSISNKCILKSDIRVPYYNDSFLGIETSFTDNQDVFIDKYFEMAYRLSDGIWISMGYGVNPSSMDVQTDEFHYMGREEYLDNISQLPAHIESYYGGTGEKIRSAENALMDEKQISVQAVIKF